MMGPPLQLLPSLVLISSPAEVAASQRCGVISRISYPPVEYRTANRLGLYCYPLGPLFHRTRGNLFVDHGINRPPRGRVFVLIKMPAGGCPPRAVRWLPVAGRRRRVRQGRCSSASNEHPVAQTEDAAPLAVIHHSHHDCVGVIVVSHDRGHVAVGIPVIRGGEGTGAVSWLARTPLRSVASRTRLEFRGSMRTSLTTISGNH